MGVIGYRSFQLGRTGATSTSQLTNTIRCGHGDDDQCGETPALEIGKYLGCQSRQPPRGRSVFDPRGDRPRRSHEADLSACGPTETGSIDLEQLPHRLSALDDEDLKVSVVGEQRPRSRVPASFPCGCTRAIRPAKRSSDSAFVQSSGRSAAVTTSIPSGMLASSSTPKIVAAHASACAGISLSSFQGCPRTPGLLQRSGRTTTAGPFVAPRVARRGTGRRAPGARRCAA